jgi:transposase
LNGILYVLHTGIAWEDLPQELGLGSGMTCRRRLRDWQAAGVWSRLHLAMLCRLREHDQMIGSERAWMRPALPAPGGQETGPNPTDWGKLGSKRHLVVDARGVPLAITVTGANRHDSMAFERTLDTLPAVPGLNGSPRKRPGKLHTHKG